MTAVIDAVATDHDERLLIADPFAGGGVIALSALLAGHRVYAQDVNPWAARSLVAMLDLPAATDLSAAGDRLRTLAAPVLSRAYRTTLTDGSEGEIAHTLRVASAPCRGCRRVLYLFPTAIVSLTERVDRGGKIGFVACPAGHVQFGDAVKTTRCGTCERSIDPAVQYTKGRTVACAHCGWTGRFSSLMPKPGFSWRVVLIEKTSPGTREIVRPTRAERVAAEDGWAPERELPVIGEGVETAVLRRHGFKSWGNLYPNRQRVVIEALLSNCAEAADGDARVERGLRLAVLGSVEMAGYASRWDARYLKAYEAVSNHRFTMTTLSAEPNVWGAASSGRGTVNRRLDHIAKAATWFEERLGRRPNVTGALPSNARRTQLARSVDARVVEGSSERLVLASNSLDLVLTDPPYHDDVQYGELSELFRSWGGIPLGPLDGDAIVRRTSHTDTTQRYRSVLTTVFKEARRAMRPGAHLILSYANRDLKAWIALFNALQAAGLRTVGFEVVRSENELDHAKVGKRACTLDLLVDLVDSDTTAVRQHQAVRSSSDSTERAFCIAVGESALKIGGLPAGWETEFEQTLRAHEFLKPSSPEDEAASQPGP